MYNKLTISSIYENILLDAHNKFSSVKENIRKKLNLLDLLD